LHIESNQNSKYLGQIGIQRTKDDSKHHTNHRKFKKTGREFTSKKTQQWPQQNRGGQKTKRCAKNNKPPNRCVGDLRSD
jgi:hypothetical protein